MTGNTVIGNSCEGIGLYYSSDNTVTGNSVTNNQVGISLSNSSGNSIFHNSFVNNTLRVYTVFSVNNWDGGYPCGGNYWSDYVEVDSYRGLNQNDPGSDGIRDAPLTIDANNQDHYPLTKPYGGTHDIGLVKSATTKTVISQGKDLNLTIIVINYGFATETFSATAHVDTTLLIQTQLVLTSRNSTALKFILNTTNFDKSNHTITAYAEPVPSETVTTDNTLHSWFMISILGDVNGDERVDMKDVSFVAKRFGSDPSKPNWDTNADINDDGRVDMKDISAVAKNFGKSGP
jgi:parallel beta-helix repeat protein